MKGELIVQIKGNQSELYREVQEACQDLQPISTFVSPIEKARNRIEQREAAVFEVTPYLVESHAWHEYISCVIQVKRHTQWFEAKTRVWQVREETAYYAASHVHCARTFTQHIRLHWGIENKNHYVRDVTLKEDASRIRIRPGVFARLRSFALNIFRFNRIENIAEALFENAINLDRLLIYQGVT